MKKTSTARSVLSMGLTLCSLFHGSFASVSSAAETPIVRQPQTQAVKTRPEGSAAMKADDPAPCTCEFCPDPCAELAREKREPEKREKNDRISSYIIDARLNYEATQEPCASQRQNVEFKKGERVSIYVINMNPFVYEYTVTKNETVLQETAQNIFLNRLGPLFSDFISTTGSIKSANKARATNCEADANDAGSVLKEAKASLSTWEPRYASFNGWYENIRVLYNRLLDPLARCCALCKAAKEYKTQYRNIPGRADFAQLADTVAKTKFKLESNQGLVDSLKASLRDKENYAVIMRQFKLKEADLSVKIGRLENRIRDTRAKIMQAEAAKEQERSAALKSSLQTLESELDSAEKARENLLDLEADLKTEVDGCDAATLKQIVLDQEALSIRASSLADGINTLCTNLFGKENSEKLANMNDAIDVVLAHPDILLAQHFEIGTYSEPTVVTINLTRKEKAKDDTSITAGQSSIPKPCEGLGESARRPPAEQPAPAVQQQQTTKGQAPPAANQPPPANNQQQPAKPPNPPVKPVQNSTAAAAGLFPPQPLLAMYQADTPPAGSQTAELLSQPFFAMQTPDSGGALAFAASAQPTTFAIQSGTATAKAGDTPSATPAASQDQDPPKYERKLRFGIQSFSLSGGIVFSRLERQSFVPVLGIPLDRQGIPTGTSLVNVVGYGDLNRWTVGPLLMLNTLIIEDRHGKFGLHASAGITGKKTTDDTDIDYFFGGSLNFLRRRLFLTPGVYVGKQRRLGGDAYLNAPLGATASVPTRTETHAKFGLSLTFRILPYPSQ